MKMSRGLIFLAFHYLKPLKFAWALSKWKFLQGKSISRPEKSGKVNLHPLTNNPLTALFGNYINQHFWSDDSSNETDNKY